MYEKRVAQRENEKAAWLLIAAVFITLIVILVMVYSHDKEKPKSPHALVAAGFNQLFPVQEWAPGMGKQPLVYHPAAAVGHEWKQLPPRVSLQSAGLRAGTTQHRPANITAR